MDSRWRDSGLSLLVHILAHLQTGTPRHFKQPLNKCKLATGNLPLFTSTLYIDVCMLITIVFLSAFHAVCVNGYKKL